jgi:hypothetical protein
MSLAAGLAECSGVGTRNYHNMTECPRFRKHLPTEDTAEFSILKPLGASPVPHRKSGQPVLRVNFSNCGTHEFGLSCSNVRNLTLARMAQAQNGYIGY